MAFINKVMFYQLLTPENQEKRRCASLVTGSRKLFGMECWELI